MSHMHVMQADSSRASAYLGKFAAFELVQVNIPVVHIIVDCVHLQHGVILAHHILELPAEHAESLPGVENLALFG